MQSLSELDRHLIQLDYSDFLMLNVFGKQRSISHLEHVRQAYVMLALGFCAIIMAYFCRDSVMFGVLVVIGIGLLLVGLQAQRKPDSRLLIVASVLLALTVIFTILYQFVLLADVTYTGIVLASLHSIGVIYFIGQANQVFEHPAELTPHLAEIYQTTCRLLDTQDPNKTNRLIVVRHLTHQTKLWLRSDVPVVLGRGGVFFDASLTLSMVLEGSDTGSNTMRVSVSYGDVRVLGRISRYDWLRYLQFAG